MSTSQKLPTIVGEAFKLLNDKSYSYAVLRNYEGLPEYNKSRDIDILIKESEYPHLKKDFSELIINNGYYIVNYFESERLRTFICGKVEGNIELIQFDFFTHTSAYGHILLEADDILSSRICENGIFHVSKEYEFLDKYLYLKYIGAEYPTKYNKIREQMLNNQTLNEIINNRFGISNFAVLDKMPHKIFVSIANKLGNTKNVISFWSYYLRNYISYKGFSIGFTGPDGSGKTTVINNLIKELNIVFSQVELYHFRPTVIGNLGEVAHSAGLKKSVDRDYNKPHRGGRTGVLNSFARLSYYSIDYLLGFFKVVRPSLIRRTIVIFDRYYTDIICDSRRSRIYLNNKFLYWFGKFFIPSLDYNILLTAQTNTILDRKQELDRTGIETINNKIDYLSGESGYKKVLNETTPQDAVADILKYIFEQQHKKNLKRIK